MSLPLSEYLPLIASAPEGIQKLRGLILDLAVRGKLVQQDLRDEPTNELLKKIVQERTRLESEGIFRKAKPLTPLDKNAQLFSVPDGWGVFNLGDLTLQITDGTHHTPRYIDSGVAFISVKDINGHSVSFDDCKYISEEEHNKINNRCNPEKGDILLCRIGTLGRPTIVDTDRRFSLFVSVGLLKLPKSFDISRFLHVVLTSPYMAKQYEEIKAGGSHTSKLNLGDIPRLVVPLPPLPEQHRIVAKVDELMALCDRLESEQNDSAAAHTQLVETLLGTLTQSTDANDFEANWKRIAEHFDTLFTTDASIDALQKTILQLAVMGKLVPQDLNDEPASELLKRISNRRTQLEDKGVCKKLKPLPPVSDKEQPFQTPGGWKWVRWVQIAQKIGDIDHKMPDTVKEGVPYVSPRDFFPDNRIDFEGAKKVSHDDFLKLSAKIRPEVGDIIYPRYGTIGENRLVEDNLEFLASYSCCVIKTFNGYVDPKYQFYFSISQCCRDQAKSAENKTTQANVGIKSIQEFALPLPPLAEQQRIVAKVDELMAVCDSLKKQLAESRKQEGCLADTLIQASLKAA